MTKSLFKPNSEGKLLILSQLGFLAVLLLMNVSMPLPVLICSHPECLFFCFPEMNIIKKAGIWPQESRYRLQWLFTVSIFLLDFLRLFFPPDLLDKIHTNEIQAQSVNNNEKVNPFYREDSACKTSSGMMAIFFFFAQIWSYYGLSKLISGF